MLLQQRLKQPVKDPPGLLWGLLACTQTTMWFQGLVFNASEVDD